MSGNRIRRYESLWTGTTPADKDATPGMPAEVPPGFVIFPLAHLSPAEREAVARQSDLYQRAYDQARREADEKFIRDWMI